jgi:hypothetical protein
MTPNDHNSPPVAEMNVSIVGRYLAPDNDPDMQEYDNVGDTHTISEDRDE